MSIKALALSFQERKKHPTTIATLPKSPPHLLWYKKQQKIILALPELQELLLDRVWFQMDS